MLNLENKNLSLELSFLNKKILCDTDFSKTFTQFFQHTHKIIKDRSQVLDVVSKNTLRSLFKKDFNFIHLDMSDTKTSKIIFP